MNYKELLNYSKKYLNESKIEDSSMVSKLLIQYVCKVPKEKLIIFQEDEVSELEFYEYKRLLEKISKGYPIQYITNSQEFMKLNFYVDENVLIPQPDTEILVENVINTYSNINNNIEILDLCTGSGSIGISLAKYIKKSHITATDISNKALQIAKLNAEKNLVHKKITFIESDMFKNIDQKEFDVLVSNPPYIRTNVIKLLDKQVQTEPKIALDGGTDGLQFYRIIANNAYKYIKEDGKLCLEIGYDQREEVFDLLKKVEFYNDIICIKDLSGNDRAIIATVRR